MTFNNTKSARRCDADFDLLLLPNEYRVQDCILRDLQVGKVSQFPIDYMHLTFLGLVRRMARDWQDGLLHSKAFPFNVRRAIHWLEQFVNDYVKYYGNKCVYSVHAHCHIADDARIYGVLDNFSAFLFESYLGKLKGMVHKSHHVVQQIASGLSEREVSNTLPENRTVLKHRHHNGPQIEGRPDLLQYGDVCLFVCCLTAHQHYIGH